MSRNFTSCHVMPRHATSCHVISLHVMSCHVMPRHATSCHVMSRNVPSCHVMPRHVTSCHVLSRHVTSRHGTSCHVESRGTVTQPTLHCRLTFPTRNWIKLGITVFVGCPEECRYHTESAVFNLVLKGSAAGRDQDSIWIIWASELTIYWNNSQAIKIIQCVR